MTNRTLIAAVVLLLGSASQVAVAQTAGVCPVRAQGEADQSFSDRTHGYCEARWSELLAAKQTGGRTHDEYINICSSKCAGAVGSGVTGTQLGLIIGGVALVGAGVAVAASSHHGNNAPASP
jgi:hypothetical protein